MMTDKEIIKALKSVAEWFTEHGRNTNTAVIGISKQAIDLINRQKAETEQLKSDVSVSRDAYMSMKDRYQYEKEKVKTAKQKVIDIARVLKTAKAEAYKEFADRLCEDRLSNDPVVIAVKVELKELVGR